MNARYALLLSVMPPYMCLNCLGRIPVVVAMSCCLQGTCQKLLPFVQVSVMVQEHREEVGRLHEYIQGSY